MDDHQSQDKPLCLPPTRRTKGKAPLPPSPITKSFDGSRFSPTREHPNVAMDQKENLIDKDISLTVVLPGGTEKTATVHGSKPMMDLLIMLCGKYHLNPSSHTIELVSTNRNQIKFKPNALIGALDAEKIILKPKGGDERNKKAAPQMPEATVRLVINYKKTQKTILRVNPRVPLEELIPAVSEKCEFDPKSTVLLKDVHSQDPLDLSKSLNDHGIREVYARDTKGVSATDLQISSMYQEDKSSPTKDKTLKDKENKGLFSIFRRSKKKSEQATTVSAPASPTLSQQRPGSMCSLSANATTYSSNTLPSEMPKKRRAPLPPMVVSQSFPTNLSEGQTDPQPDALPESDQDLPGLTRGSSSESSLKRTKRKAPAPPSSPCKITQDETEQDSNIKAGLVTQCTLEGITEKEEMAVSATQDATIAAATQEGEQSPPMSADIPADPGNTEPNLLPVDVEMKSVSNGTKEDELNDVSTDGKQAVDLINKEECSQQTLKVTEDCVTADLDHTEKGDLRPAEQMKVQERTSGDKVVSLDGGKKECNAEVSVALQSVPVNSTSSQTPKVKPVMQDAAIQASDLINMGCTVKEESDKVETEGDYSAMNSQGGDLQGQNAIKAHLESSVENQDASALAELSSSEQGVLKKDMATSTEELDSRESENTLPQALEVSSEFQDTLATQTPLIYKKDCEPKPKPSNEVTRDYIPKVGLTTYKIVPQKSLEKLKFFEVQLTLEVPDGTVDQEASYKSPEHLDIRLHTKVPQDSVVQRSADSDEIHPYESSSVSGVNNTTANSNHTASNNIAPVLSPHASSVISEGASKETKPFSLSDVGRLPSLTSPLREKKVPPATKPKPGSFRLPQHKRTAGDYVTSAAFRSGSTSSVSSQSEISGSPGKEQEIRSEKLFEDEEENVFPPPPPPVMFEETSEGRIREQGKPGSQTADIPGMATKFSRQMSLPNKQPAGLSFEKFRSFAAPKPYTSTAPSPFALAVSSAVKRSHSFSRGSTGHGLPSRGLPTSSFSERFATKELKEPAQPLVESSVPGASDAMSVNGSSTGLLPSKTE
ncbi:cordon-bleu protein-like 1b isoform X2 [Amia ocellicauda]|uniref:cordon-bleu protein-like 1b isoform X2 n=1 Tax=Amia ocellicauda TaxID=2972642 RepID=UPI00346402F0